MHEWWLDLEVSALERARIQCNLDTLVFAQGTPMLAGGDDIGHSQGGNNNAYNQDNPTGWLDWAAADDDLHAFTARCLALRRDEPALRHDRWFVPAPSAAGESGVVWLAPDARELADGDWNDPAHHAFACHITHGPAADPASRRLLIVFNPQDRVVPFVLPARRWALLLDSSGELPPGPAPEHLPLQAPAHALLLLAETAAG